MSTLRARNLYQDLKELLPQLINHPGVNPPHPTYTAAFMPYFHWHWGSRPDECKKGQPICYAFPGGRTAQVDTACSEIHRLTFNIGILQQVNDAREDMFYQMWGNLQRLFGIGGTNLIFDQNPTTLNGETFQKPYTLGNFGIAGTQYFGSDTIRFMGTDECPFMTIEMVVEWELHFESYFKNLPYAF